MQLKKSASFTLSIVKSSVSSVKKTENERKIEKEKSYDRRAENENVKKRKKKKMVRKENFLQVDNFGVCFILKKKFCSPQEFNRKMGIMPKALDVN